MNVGAPTVPIVEQPVLNVIRPVNDLWLWWTLAHVIGYLVAEISSKLLGKSFVGEIVSLLAMIVSIALVIWVLNRYLSNFNGKRWVIVSVVGAVLGILVAAFGAFFLVGIVNMVNHSIIGNNSMDWLVSAIGTAVVGALTLSWIVAVAQWRVLESYTRGYGRNMWIIANIVSGFIATLSYTITSHLTDNVYVQVTSGIVANTIVAVIVGYTLMQILRPYAPSST